MLIEKSRTSVSDGSGQYRIDQLRPGTYTVTFTLSGFSTFRREGVEISEGFTAPVPATLTVGAVKDTITVEAQAPVVDVQDVSEHRTLVNQELDALPTAGSFATLGTTLPSVAANQNDVGGSQGEKGNVLAAHGGNGFDMTLNVDGIAISNMGTTTNSGAAWSTFSLNPAARPGNVIRNRCEFRGVGQRGRPRKRDSAGGRQRVPRNRLCQWRQQCNGEEQLRL